MSYAVYDVNGYVGDMASGGGLQDAREQAAKEGNKELLRFFNEGYAEPAELIETLGEPIGDPEVVDTLNNLKALAGKCEELVIISNGIEESEESEESD